MTLKEYERTYIIYIYTEGYNESTELIDAVNILPLTRFDNSGKD